MAELVFVAPKTGYYMKEQIWSEKYKNNFFSRFSIFYEMANMFYAFHNGSLTIVLNTQNYSILIIITTCDNSETRLMSQLAM